MANVTITKYLGHIKIDFGSYFPTGTLEKTHYFPPHGWLGICTLRTITNTPNPGDYEDGVEFHVSHEADSYKLTSQPGLTAFMQVDSVNGVTPATDEELIDLIINLIQ